MKRVCFWLCVLFSGGLFADYNQNSEDRSYNPFTFGSFLYWNCREGSLEFAVQANSTTLVGSSGTPTILSGQLVGASSESLALGMTPGFRVGIGCLLPWEKTDVVITYTQVNVSNSKTVTPSRSKLLFPILADPALTPSFVTKASAKRTIDFQNIDADFEKKYRVGKVLSLFPSIGLKGALIAQHKHVTYTGFTGDDTTNTDITNGAYALHDKNSFWGIGPKLGGSSDWNLGKGWHFFGQMFGSLLVGQFHIYQNHKINSQPIVDFTSNLYPITPTGQLSFGFDWNYDFRYCGLQIKAAYETQYWWSQNQLAYFTTTSPYFLRENTDLGFQGLTLSVMLTF